MDAHEVARWVSYESAKDMDTAVDTMGGWVQPGVRWDDYLKCWPDAPKPYIEALRSEIIKIKLRKGGDWHQYSCAGVPVFEDDRVALFSYRGWGDLLAAVWNTEEVDAPYSYLDFYMSEEEDEHA